MTRRKRRAPRTTTVCGLVTDYLATQVALRSTLGEHAVSVDVHFSQYYQHVVDGGTDTGGGYGGILDYIVNVDGHKLGLWKGLIANRARADEDWKLRFVRGQAGRYGACQHAASLPSAR